MLLVLQRLNYLKETTAWSGEAKEGDSKDAAFTRTGGAGDHKHEGGDSAESSKTALSAEALQREEEEFAKLEAQFIAELDLKSDELPDYAKQMGTDLAPPPEEGKSNSKGMR
jgi:hypothetical protein